MTCTPITVGRCRTAACGLVALLATATTAAPQASSRPADGDTPARSAVEALEAKYLVGPQLAEDFGLRVVWQTQPLATKDAHGQALGDSPTSCWFGDSAGSVVRLRKDTGETVWRSSTNQGVERMVAIEHLPTSRADNVYVVTELNSVTLDATTGSLVRTSDFSHLPSRLPAVFGPSMVYGTRTGLCCWFQYGTGYNWRATSLGGSVLAPVTVHGQMMLVGSTSGSVYAMDAATAGILWTRKLSAGIEAQIAADDEACFVAGLDQSLWAFDMQRGRVLWQHFTTSPLRNAPTRIADGLYLQIPGEGLVSFTPVPKDKPDGEIRWRSKAVGNVAMRLKDELFAWDQPTRTLTAVDAATGRVIREARLPRVDLIRFGARIDGDIVVMSRDGIVERLETLQRPSAPAASASAAPAP